MKAKILYKNFQIHDVPFERVVFDDQIITDRYILLDDINEKRWKIKFKVYQALKITTIDCAGLDFSKGGDFEDACFEDKEGFPVPQFQSHIMEVENSEWIKEMKKTLKRYDLQDNFMEKSRHFLIPCYDNIIEIIAWDIELEEVK